MLNNRIAQQALKQAAGRVKSGVQQGAESFVEREVGPMRERLAYLEAEVVELRRSQTELAERLARLERGG